MENKSKRSIIRFGKREVVVKCFYYLVYDGDRINFVFSSRIEALKWIDSVLKSDDKFDLSKFDLLKLSLIKI